MNRPPWPDRPDTIPEEPRPLLDWLVVLLGIFAAISLIAYIASVG